jgi:hypothetical protein
MDIVTGNTRSFDNNLQGTWVPNDPDALYKGSLKIEYDRITITGYGESQTPSGGNDNNRPFKNFSKGIALKGYSEEGKIFIEDGGLLQEGIPYTYWENSLSYGYNNEKLLRFTFDGRDETLQKQ